MSACSLVARRGVWIGALLGGLLLAPARAAAQLPPGGYYAGGAYYAPAEPAAPVPSQDETAYWRGVYAYAPGFGPYLRLGGESGWNPLLGSTYNAYPFGDYYSDYGLLPPARYYVVPVGVLVVRPWPRYGPWR
jgi:hypothetical protein